MYGRHTVLPKMLYYILKGYVTWKRAVSNKSCYDNIKLFSYVVKQMNKEKEKRKRKNDEKENLEEINVGDPVYFVNHSVLSKHDCKWREVFYVLKKLSQVTCYIKNHLTGKLYRT